MTRRRPAVRRRGRLTTALLAPVVVLVLLAAGCSGGADDGGRSADLAGATSGGGEARPAVATTATIGTITGRLEKRRRAPLRAAVREVVDRWFDAAYVGGSWPRADLDRAFPGFTARARAEARRDAALMSNQRIGRRLTAVAATRRQVRVDVLGVRGHAVGVTARVVLGFRTSGAVRRHETLRGLLRLTKVDGQWKVFAYDVSRGPARGPAGAGKGGGR